MPENAAAAPSSARTHVGELVGDELLAGADVQAHAELVGHRARRREERRLVAEQRGDALLQGADRRVLAEDVVADLGVRHRRRIAGVGRVRVSESRSSAAGPASVLACVSISATRNASSSACWWFRRGSHTVS